MDRWQSEAVELILETDEAGCWARSEAGLIVPRQNGKGAVEEAIELDGLFLSPPPVLEQGASPPAMAHTAHEVKTAVRGFERLVAHIERKAFLRKRVKHIYRARGDQMIEVYGPCEDCDKFTCQHARPINRCIVIARSTGSGRGFTIYRLVLDEAFKLTDATLGALLPTMAAVADPLTFYGSSAAHDAEWSEVLRRIMRRGRDGDPSLTYIEYSAERDTGDDDCLAQANPAWDTRINQKLVRSFRVAMSSEEFDREFLGIVDLTEQERGWSVISEQLWGQAFDPSSAPVSEDGPFSFALDVSADRAWSSFVVACHSTLGGVHFELADRLPGTDGAVARAKELTSRWGVPLALAENSPAWSLKPALDDAGVPLLAVKTGENAQACGDMYDAFKAKEVHHLGEPALTEAVKVAERRPYGDAWLLTRTKSAGDISPFVAATLARWVLLHQPAEEPKPQPFILTLGGGS